MTVREAKGRERFSSGAMLAATIIFLVLGVALSAVMSFYRSSVLEPRLRDEAKAQAEILSRSQAGFIAGLLRGGGGEKVRRAALEAALEELLLLRDPASRTPYFAFVSLEVDAEALGVAPGALDLRRGDVTSNTAFATPVALYDPKTSEVLGVATFGVSDRLFRELSARVGEELFRVTLAVLLLLVVLWAVLMAVFAQLERQTGRRFAAERELSRQEKRYERLVNNLSQYFVYRKDPSGRLISVSDSVQRVLGFAPSEFLGRHAGSLLAPAHAQDAPPPFEVEIQDAHGLSHRIELSEVAVASEAGVAIAYDGIARDVTAERRFREELLHAKDEAEAANRAKSRFLANMSHEIRTPLNAILGMSGLALRTLRDPRERDYLEKVRVSARLLVEIVEDVLDLARIEAGRLELASETFALEPLLSEIRDVVGARAAARGLEIRFENEGALPGRLSGDPVRLKQVLLNLLNNAIKFTDDGSVAVRIAPVEVRRDRAILRFAVADTGIGIPESHLPTLFKPFTQVDTSNTRRYAGMGLGLAISRRLVRLMGGDIEVTSRLGEGSRFTFTATFGLAPALAPLSAASLSDASVMDKNMKPSVGAVRFAGDQSVLLVEDQALNREVARELLTRAGLIVREATDGEEALREIERSRPDVVLMDVQMPGMDGLSAVRAIRGNAALVDLPVVAMTAHAMLGDRERCLEAGMNDYVPKPFEEAQLFGVLSRWLRREASEAATSSESVGAGVTASPSGGALVLDREAGLRRAGGNRDLYDRLVRGLAAEGATLLESLRRSAAAGDRALLRRDLHTLKGNAGTVSALELAREAAALEARVDDLSSAEAFDALALAVERLALAAPPAPADGARPDAGTPTPVILTPEQRGRAREALAALETHLAAGNLAARRSFTDVLRLAAPAYPAEVAAIGAALDRLDFTTAASSATALAARMDEEGAP